MAPDDKSSATKPVSEKSAAAGKDITFFGGCTFLVGSITGGQHFKY